MFGIILGGEGGGGGIDIIVVSQVMHAAQYYSVTMGRLKMELGL